MTKIYYIDRTHRSSIIGTGFETILTIDGDREWWHDRLLHREDGPAIESGLQKNLWFLNGIRLFDQQIKILKQILYGPRNKVVLYMYAPFKEIIAKKLIIPNYNPKSIIVNEKPRYNFSRKLL